MTRYVLYWCRANAFLYLKSLGAQGMFLGWKDEFSMYFLHPWVCYLTLVNKGWLYNKKMWNPLKSRSGLHCQDSTVIWIWDSGCWVHTIFSIFSFLMTTIRPTNVKAKDRKEGMCPQCYLTCHNWSSWTETEFNLKKTGTLLVQIATSCSCHH